MIQEIFSFCTKVVLTGNFFHRTLRASVNRAKRLAHVLSYLFHVKHPNFPPCQLEKIERSRHPKDRPGHACTCIGIDTPEEAKRPKVSFPDMP